MSKGGSKAPKKRETNSWDVLNNLIELVKALLFYDAPLLVRMNALFIVSVVATFTVVSVKVAVPLLQPLHLRFKGPVYIAAFILCAYLALYRPHLKCVRYCKRSLGLKG